MVALDWLLDLLGLPSDSAGAFVTGTTVAHFTALAAALRETNWGGWLIVEENRQPGRTSGEQAKAAKQFLERKMSL